ncbi:MAG: ABC transporter ATP-binding protein [Patescibacteria group bacterium]
MFKTLATYHKYLTIRKKWFALFILMIIAGVVIDFATPYFSKLFIEKIQSGNFDNVVNLLFVYLGVLILGNVFSNLKNFSGDVSAVDGALTLKSDVFRRIHDLDFAFHSNRSTGSLISIFKRGENAFWDLSDKIYQRVFTVLVGFVILIWYFARLDVRIVGIFIGSSLITILITRVLLPLNIRGRQRLNDKDDEISGIVTDNLINYETVKLFANEERELNRLKINLQEWKKIVWKYFLTYRYIDTSLGNLINLSIFLVFLLSFNLVRSASIGLSDFVLIVSAVAMFFPQLFNLVYSVRNLSQGYVDIKKYVDILDLEPDVKDPENEVKLDSVSGKIVFNDVSYSYKEGRLRAVKNINLKIEPGESVALVGRSGVGKTTLVRLLMRFFDVDKGSITIDGIDVRNFSKSKLRSFMGVVPQEPILFNNTIGYNIAYGASNASTQEIKAAAKMANLADFIETLSDKYDTHVGERGIKLSGGQKQRLAIARMILSNPDIVIFDEATSQLDSESEKLIQDAFWKAVKNKTTIIIAHRLSTVMKANRIVVMEKGKIAEEGSHKELLLKKNSLYRHFWELQITSN